MNFVGFSQSDFDIFLIPGLEARMKVLIDQLRPKLDHIGREIAPTLSTIYGEEFYPHVAKHARRTINPPNDTWVAWANDKRGYKKHPHLQVGMWSTHLFIWFALIYESPMKEAYATSMLKKLDQIYDIVPADFEWSWDHMQPGTTSHGDMTKEELEHQLRRVQTIKKAELLCGVTIPSDDPILTDDKALIVKISHTFTQLQPLYMINRHV